MVRYIQLAHNEWDSKAGYSKVKILFNLGREEQVDRAGLKRLVSSINRFLGPEEILAARAETDAGLRFVGSRPIGGTWFLHGLWQRLGIDKVLNGFARGREFRHCVERAIFAMVANRALAPASKLGVEEWVAHDTYIPNLAEVPVHKLYRAMDFLLEADEALQYQVFGQVSHLFNMEVDLLYFDTTSTYFEIENEDDFRKNGLSKDHRPDLPQAVIGLAVTREGIPVRCWVWPGNTADMSVLEQVKDDLVGWKLGRVITVLDRGFSSEANLRYLQRAGGHYIVGEKLRSGKDKTKEALSRPGRYQRVRDNLEVKEIIIGDGQARVRYVLVRNPQEAAKDKAKRDGIISRIEQELQAIGDLNGAPHTKAVCSLIAHPSYGRYLKTNQKGQPTLNRAKIKAEEKLDGKYLLRTSDDTITTEDVALGYKQLLEVEDAFRTLKTTLELRPVYHRLEGRIRSHVLLCWLALLLIRCAEVETKHTWRRMRRELQRMHLGEFQTADGRVMQTTEPTPLLKQLFRAVKVPQPPRILDICLKE